MSIPTDVWLIYPGKFASRFRDARKATRSLCTERGWVFQERATRTVNLRSSGRTREVLPKDAVTQMYRRAHRARLAAIVLARTFVFLHPTEAEAIRRDAIGRFQRVFWYKSFIECLGDTTKCDEEWLRGFADRFESACLDQGCENEHDPRCLPLHVFANSGRYDLFLPAERGAFEAQYGSGGSRVDGEKRQWRLSPRAYHGHEQLFIAGTALPKGMHWDVQPGGGSTIVTTTSAVWFVSRYVNIYPDSHVRGDRPHAKRLV